MFGESMSCCGSGWPKATSAAERVGSASAVASMLVVGLVDWISLCGAMPWRMRSMAGVGKVALVQMVRGVMMSHWYWELAVLGRGTGLPIGGGRLKSQVPRSKSQGE